MNTIPWYRSPVFTVALTAALVQLVGMLDATFIEGLVSGKAGALTQLGGFLLTAIVTGLRAFAGAQPITLTQKGADEKNAAAVPTLRQGGFVRPMVLALLLACAVIALPVLQGCTALGLQQAQTFNQRYAYALSQTTAIRETARLALESRQIGVADAEYALKLTNQSRELLDSARLVHEAGDPATAEGKLVLVTRVLTELQTYLNTRHRT